MKILEMRDIRCFDLIHLENFDRRHYHHLSKKDPPRNLRVTVGFGTPEDPTAPATAGACEAAACSELLRWVWRFQHQFSEVSDHLDLQVLQIYWKTYEIINCQLIL